jgi:hypothetical protein
LERRRRHLLHGLERRRRHLLHGRLHDLLLHDGLRLHNGLWLHDGLRLYDGRGFGRRLYDRLRQVLEKLG